MTQLSTAVLIIALAGCALPSAPYNMISVNNSPSWVMLSFCCAVTARLVRHSATDMIAFLLFIVICLLVAVQHAAKLHEALPDKRTDGDMELGAVVETVVGCDDGIEMPLVGKGVILV